SVFTVPFRSAAQQILRPVYLERNRIIFLTGIVTPVRISGTNGTVVIIPPKIELSAPGVIQMPPGIIPLQAAAVFRSYPYPSGTLRIGRLKRPIDFFSGILHRRRDFSLSHRVNTQPLSAPLIVNLRSVTAY